MEETWSVRAADAKEGQLNEVIAVWMYTKGGGKQRENPSLLFGLLVLGGHAHWRLFGFWSDELVHTVLVKETLRDVGETNRAGSRVGIMLRGNFWCCSDNKRMVVPSKCLFSRPACVCFGSMFSKGFSQWVFRSYLAEPYPVFFTDVVQLKAPGMGPDSAEHLEILKKFGPRAAPAPL